MIVTILQESILRHFIGQAEDRSVLTEKRVVIDDVKDIVPQPESSNSLLQILLTHFATDIGYFYWLLDFPTRNRCAGGQSATKSQDEITLSNPTGRVNVFGDRLRTCGRS